MTISGSAIITAAIILTGLVISVLGLVAFAIHKLYKVAENVLILGRATSAKDYVEAVDSLKSGEHARLAKDAPKTENEEADLFELPDGRLVAPLRPGDPL